MEKKIYINPAPGTADELWAGLDFKCFRAFITDDCLIVFSFYQNHAGMLELCRGRLGQIYAAAAFEAPGRLKVTNPVRLIQNGLAPARFVRENAGLKSFLAVLGFDLENLEILIA